jgi:hypothetical protein
MSIMCAPRARAPYFETRALVGAAVQRPPVMPDESLPTGCEYVAWDTQLPARDASSDPDRRVSWMQRFGKQPTQAAEPAGSAGRSPAVTLAAFAPPGAWDGTPRPPPRVASANVEKWDDKRCLLAAEAGDLDGLLSVHASGSLPLSSETLAAAARGGHLQLLRWLRHGAGVKWEDSANNMGSCPSAAAGGHLGVLQFARGDGCVSPCLQSVSP